MCAVGWGPVDTMKDCQSESHPARQKAALAKGPLDAIAAMRHGCVWAKRPFHQPRSMDFSPHETRRPWTTNQSATSKSARVEGRGTQKRVMLRQAVLLLIALGNCEDQANYVRRHGHLVFPRHTYYTEVHY